ncbi:MAG: translocation/assembly module TamB domain-containing protein [Smithellaceae bacterium]|nr:translocation/assembly module TamB domain-containing protein [Smithellaceae bacterium]
MKRTIKVFLLLFAAVLVAGLSGVIWLITTADGVRWLMETVSSHTDVRISAQKIEGKLAGALRLEGLDIGWPAGKIRIRTLSMQTDPRDWIAGSITVQHLIVQDVSILDNTPDAPPNLVWPRASGLIRLASGRIERLEVYRLSYTRPDQEPLLIEKATAGVVWKDAQLALGDVSVLTDPFALNGSVVAGFGRPALDVNLAAVLSFAPAGLNVFRLGGKFGPGKEAGDLQGNFLLTAGRQPGAPLPLWKMTGRAGMTKEGFPFADVRLTRPGKPGLVTANGRLTLGGPEPVLALEARASGIDLYPEINVPTRLSGVVSLSGTPGDYQGLLALTNDVRGPQAFHLESNFRGNTEGLALSDLRGKALDGVLAGGLTIDWREAPAVTGALSVRNLNPAAIDPSWTGAINFDLSGKAIFRENHPPRGEIACLLRESRLHGRELKGNLDAAFDGKDIRIARLTLAGKGFSLSAAGSVKNKVTFQARVDDSSRLIPQTAGSFEADGWARWRGEKPGGALTLRARNWQAGPLALGRAQLSAVVSDQTPLSATLDAVFGHVRWGGLAADTGTIKAGGTAKAHTVSVSLGRGRSRTILLALSGSYDKETWQGKILKLEGQDGVGSWRLALPASLSVTPQRVVLAPLRIEGAGRETLRLSGAASLDPFTASLAIDWSDLNLARANFWLEAQTLAGTTSGRMSLQVYNDERVTLSGNVTLAGALQAEGKTFAVRRGDISLKADEKGTLVRANLLLAEEGRVQGQFVSSDPARLALPETGRFQLQVDGLDPGPLATALPGRAGLEGRIRGEAAGKLLPEGRFSLAGRAELARSRLSWRGPRGDVRMNLRDAALDFTWEGETLHGNLTLALAEYGKLDGRFRLPLPARWPVALDRHKPFDASLAGKVREKGALGLLFPGLVQESRGELTLDVQANGTPAAPRLAGRANLSQAGAYLPTAGILLQDTQISARLEDETIFIDSFRAVSGPGHLEGSAQIRLSGWRIAGFEGRLQGDRFQTIYFPELQVQSSPRLSFAGTMEKVSVRGEVLLPVVQIVGMQSDGPVEASSDVIREGQTRPAASKGAVDLDVAAKVTLGDAVFIKAAGIDAQLGGAVDLQFRDPERIYGRGEIRVVKGRFRTYGVNLDIDRGRIFYAGGPIDRPAVDLLAWRKIGDIRAGVTVSGTLPHPLVKLYSEPPMPDMDVLAYIVLGHPLGADTGEANLLVMAAGALLTSQQSESIQRQIKDRLGLDTFDIKSDVLTQNGHMGYKRIPVGPAGSGAAGSGQSVPETLLVVGKYLTPQLYISYGRSLFSGGNLFFLRYDIYKNWQVETQTGQTSGVDIYYKIEFN